MNLYFENSFDERRIIGTPKNLKEAEKIIKKFLKEKKYKSYYTRVWCRDGETIFDVGSHSEFFILDCEIDIDGEIKKQKESR